jgi:hypothetical protein
MVRLLFKVFGPTVVLFSCSIVQTTYAQTSKGTPDVTFIRACAAVSAGGSPKDATLDALIVAAEQIVGPIATDDRCAVYERALQKLTGLEISAAELSDIRLLSTLTNLEELELRNNHIADLSPLANLTNLKILDFTSNNAKDLAPLRRMTKLRFLWASGNQITDLRPLGILTDLDSVHLENNSIRDVAPLANLRIGLISLGHNQITSIGALSQMPNIIRIYAHSNKIVSVSDFTPPKTLKIINLSDNPIGDDEINSLARRMGIASDAFRGDGIYDMQKGTRIVFTKDDEYKKDIDFVPTARTIKVKVE